jgi:hypothetical protein
MKALLFFCLIIGVTSCSKESSMGDVTFYINTYHNSITVSVDGKSAVITGYYPTGVSGCNVQACANFKLLAGTYNFTADESGLFGDTWESTVTVSAGGCTPVLLY